MCGDDAIIAMEGMVVDGNDNSRLDLILSRHNLVAVYYLDGPCDRERVDNTVDQLASGIKFVQDGGEIM